MSKVLNKKQMSEEDIKLHYITPSFISKWNKDKITMETQITDGRINIRGKSAKATLALVGTVREAARFPKE